MANQPDKILRAQLPIPDVSRSGLTTYDAKDPDTKFPPIEPLRPPAGAPNVLIVLLDDVGFGASSAFGGPCHTPTFEKLAAEGLKYNRFHTCALCAPTRQALMTGRNHHSVGMGNITETATAAPGQSSLRPNTKAPVALTLKLNGYSTAMFGKCHEVPVWESSPMGPFEHWPAGGGGFEYFYGFIGGENNQWDPALYEGNWTGKYANNKSFSINISNVNGFHAKVRYQSDGIVKYQDVLIKDASFRIGDTKFTWAKDGTALIKNVVTDPATGTTYLDSASASLTA